MSRASRLLGPLLAGVLVLSACSGGGDTDASPDDSTSAASSSPSPAAEPPAAPEAGECHRLSLAEATQPVAQPDATVPCERPHTSVTLAVRPLDLLEDGHLLAVDSPQAQQRLARTCSPRLLERAGGDERARRLSRLEVVWFTPSDEELQAGADWVRCDAVAVASEDRLLRLPPRFRGLLDRDGALDTYGTCGTASPAADGFQRVACARPHDWRAVDVVDLPADARFLDDAVTQDADSTCQDLTSELAGDSLDLTWAFEWPTRAQWRSGQRYGWCWNPV